MRIGILTFHRAYNCGAMLQAWALRTVLERMGHTVEFPACNDVGYKPAGRMVEFIPKEKKGLSWLRSYLGRKYLDFRGIYYGPARGVPHNRFRKKYLPERQCEPIDFDKYYDCIIFGSDQIFSPRHTEIWQGLFLGENCPTSLKKIVYAGSIGDHPLEGINYTRWKNAMRQMNAISLRESFENYQVVLDPTLLLKAEDYSALKANRLVKPKKNYILLYSCDLSEFQVSLARKIAQHEGLELIIVPAYPSEWSKSLPESYEAISPDRLVYLIKNARYVLAGSFHASVFSILYQKKFLSLRNNINETSSRFHALLQRLGIIEHLVNPAISFEIALQRMETPIPSESLVQLDNLRHDSISWLRNSLI